MARGMYLKHGRTQEGKKGRGKSTHDCGCLDSPGEPKCPKCPPSWWRAPRPGRSQRRGGSVCGPLGFATWLACPLQSMGKSTQEGEIVCVYACWCVRRLRGALFLVSPLSPFPPQRHERRQTGAGGAVKVRDFRHAPGHGRGGSCRCCSD